MPVPDGGSDGVGEPSGVRDGVGKAVIVGVAVGAEVSVAVADWLGVAVAVWVGESEGVGDKLGLGVCVASGVIDGGTLVGVAVAVKDGGNVAEGEGVGDIEGKDGDPSSAHPTTKVETMMNGKTSFPRSRVRVFSENMRPIVTSVRNK
ncbi:hypothetical protein HRbin30_01643 [bacterium HR30]|nr:hypothetical protein HRbin30_01643 [bacterium HR30]